MKWMVQAAAKSSRRSSGTRFKPTKAELAFAERLFRHKRREITHAMEATDTDKDGLLTKALPFPLTNQ